MSNNKVLDTALVYINRGINVFPIQENKKIPAMKWEQFQLERVTEDMAREWWGKHPEWNIAMACGPISERFVLDVDSYKNPEEASKLLNALAEQGCFPIVRTPRGGFHFYFKYDSRITNRATDNVDIKAEGGYVLVPPSVVDGKPYAWAGKQHSIQLTNTLYTIIKEYTLYIEGNSSPKLQVATGSYNKIPDGERDNTLFHYAWELRKAGVKKSLIEEIVMKLGLYACEKGDDPLTEKDIAIKIQSAMQREMKLQENVAEEVRNWVLATSGYFLTTDCYKELGLSNTKLQKSAMAELVRMTKSGLIEKHGDKRGCYRVPDKDMEPINLDAVKVEDSGLWLPFGIGEKLVYITPKTLIVIAGAPNSGKTAFMLNMLKENARKFKVTYFSSEMGAMEFKSRLSLFREPVFMKNVQLYERSDNFHDVVRPNDLNLIDFMEIGDNFYQVANKLGAIFNKLKKGIAVVALQKNFGAKLGRGGTFSMEKPRLYLSIDRDVMGEDGPATYDRGKILTIVKAKNYRDHTNNPNGQYIHFDIERGCDLIQMDRDWQKGEEL